MSTRGQGCTKDPSALDGINHAYLDIHSHDVLRKINRDSTEWEAMVPPKVAAAIKERGLFGYV